MGILVDLVICGCGYLIIGMSILKVVNLLLVDLVI